MIFGDLTNFDKEEHLFPEAVRRGIDYIRRLDLGSKEPGKYELEGTLMYALVQEVHTRHASRQRLESHDCYADIQFLVSGEEKIGLIRHSPNMVVTENKLMSDDIAFYESGEAETEILLKPGKFAVFFPSDIHRPCCSAVEDRAIKKVVIKIHKQLWHV